MLLTEIMLLLIVLFITATILLSKTKESIFPKSKGGRGNKDDVILSIISTLPSRKA